jgi:hypothetical protein
VRETPLPQIARQNGLLPICPSVARDTKVNLRLAAARRLQKVADAQGCEAAYHRHIHGQYAVQVETGLCSLQCEQRLDHHARSSQQDERGRDQCDRKDAQPPIRSAGDAHSSATEVDALRRVTSGQPRDKSEEYHNRQGRAGNRDP